MQTQKQTSININTMHDCSSIGHNCGYCHNPKGSYTWGFQCLKMTCQQYENLMNKGWRRCGSYFYKPNLEKSCCKCYTIRMNCETFKIKKQQRKTVKTMLDLVIQKQKNKGIKRQVEKVKNEVQKVNKKEQKKMTIEKALISKQQQEMNEKHVIILKSLLNNSLQIIKEDNENLKKLLPLKQNGNINFEIGDGIKIFINKDNKNKGDFYSNFAMLLFGKNKNLFIEKTTLQDVVKKIEPFLIEKLQKLSSQYLYSIQYSGYLIFKIKQKQIKKKSQKSQQYQVVPKYKSEDQLKKKQSDQFIIFKAQSPKKSDPLNVIQQQSHNWPNLQISYDKIKFGLLQVQIVPVQESIQSFRLYQKYNKNVHDKKQKQMSSYTNFLCVDSLYNQKQTKNIQQQITFQTTWDQKAQHLKPTKIKGQVKKMKGCYHMKYYLSDRLIGVGVIDIVKNGISSVYFFYDHNYKQYRLGVFSSLLQIQYTRYLNKVFPQFKYYYMGFYIQNCQKMNYKADYQPCELLCPITYTYVTVDKSLRQRIQVIIDKKTTAKLSAPGTQLDSDLKISGDVGLYVDQNIKLYYRNQKLNLRQLDKMFSLRILILMKSMILVLGKKIYGQLKFEIVI